MTAAGSDGGHHPGSRFKRMLSAILLVLALSPENLAAAQPASRKFAVSARRWRYPKRRGKGVVRAPRIVTASAAPPVITPPPAPPSVKPEIDTDTEIAKRHFQLGLGHYEKGEYASALFEFKTARQVKPHPAFDYNIGKCEDRMEHIPEAIEAYQRYLEAMPDAPDAPEVTRRVAVLDFRRARASEIGRPPEPAVPHASAGPPPPTARSAGPDLRHEGWFARRNALPIGVGGLAAVSLVTGAALLGSVVPDYNRLHDTCAGHCGESDVGPIEDRARAGYALVTIGAAAAAADGVLWYLAMRKKRQLPLAIAPMGFGAVVAGTF